MDGLILIDKPENITSFGAVAKIRKLTGQKRVGHTGTLDPMATGVLPILIGRATSLSPFLLESDKIYSARIKFGLKTDSFDITGNIIYKADEKTLMNISKQEVLKALENFTGALKQTPPMFSALKKNGVPLYKLARQGKSLELEKRDIFIHYIRLLEFDEINKECLVEVKVTKGTYIRSLANDIGEFLGCGAVLKELRRTCVTGFDITECVPLDDLSESNISDFILKPDFAVKYMPEINVTLKQAVRFSNGGALDIKRLKISEPEDGELFRVSFGGDFLGVGVYNRENGEVAVKCVIKSLR